MLRKSKILILGARGMLGTDLAHEFVGSKLYLWDKEEVDVTQEKQVQEKILELKPAVVINATGFTDVDGAEDNQEMAFKINVEAVNFITAVCQQTNARLVHFSTEYVFDGTNRLGYDEKSVVNPLNVYGQSKAAGEKFIIGYSNVFLIRTSWLYGQAPQKGKPRGMNFIDTMIKLAAEHQEIKPHTFTKRINYAGRENFYHSPQRQKLGVSREGVGLKVVNDQFGKPTYTRDLAKAVYTLITANYQPGIYHLVNEGVCSWYDLAREVFEIKKIKVPILPISSSEYPTSAKRPPYAVLLNTKFPALRSWQEALQEYLL